MNSWSKPNLKTKLTNLIHDPLFFIGEQGSLRRRIALWLSGFLLIALLINQSIAFLEAREQIDETNHLELIRLAEIGRDRVQAGQGLPDLLPLFELKIIQTNERADGLWGHARLNENTIVIAGLGPEHPFLEEGDELFEEIFGEPLNFQLITLLLTVGATIYIISQLLRSLDNVGAQLRDIRPGHPLKQIEQTGTPTELHPMIDALNQAISRLDHSIEANREFSANAAHELRTPLAVLRSEIELLDEKKLGKRLAGDVVAIQRVLEQLLELSRAEHELNKQRKPVALEHVTKNLVEEIAPALISNGNQIELIVEAKPEVSGHNELIAIALRNLIENAEKYGMSEDGRAHISVEIAEAPPRIMVRDRGPGIPEPLRNELFNRFHRGDYFSERLPGSGLGLSIVNRVAELHGAKLQYATNSSSGAEFALIFMDDYSAENL